MCKTIITWYDSNSSSSTLTAIITCKIFGIYANFTMVIITCKGDDEIRSFNKFLQAGDRSKFILEAVYSRMSDKEYTKAMTAQRYYKKENEEIVKRLSFLERANNIKLNIKFHKLRNGFFPKAVKKLVLYSLSNGLSLEPNEKEQIDLDLDEKIIQAGLESCIDGVVWLFRDIPPETLVPTLHVFRATNFFPLLDDRTGQVMAGIRHWQLGDSPLQVELYELDGITEYAVVNDLLQEISPKKPYQKQVKIYPNGIMQDVGEFKKYSKLPVVPMYCNETKTSELDDGTKSYIDAYDFLTSDLIDDILQNEGMYTVVKNFGGEDLGNLLNELRYRKASGASEDTGIDINSIEVPYMAKMSALELLEKQMHADWLLPHDDSKRAVTATEIKASTAELDLKADLFEPQIKRALRELFQVAGINVIVPDFKRRTIVNDTEAVQTIDLKMTGGWIDVEEAIFADPTIQDDRKESLLKRIQLADIGVLDDEEEEKEDGSSKMYTKSNA